MTVNVSQIEGCFMTKDEHFTACNKEEQSTVKNMHKINRHRDENNRLRIDINLSDIDSSVH